MFAYLSVFNCLYLLKANTKIFTVSRQKGFAPFQNICYRVTKSEKRNLRSNVLFSIANQVYYTACVLNRNCYHSDPKSKYWIALANLLTCNAQSSNSPAYTGFIYLVFANTTCSHRKSRQRYKKNIRAGHSGAA